MESLTKENFWDEMEQKYPKAMAHFKEWVDKYKSEHNWGTLFSCEFEGDRGPENLPKYHELPIAMQFGIFCQYAASLARTEFNCTLYLVGGGFEVAVRYAIPQGLAKLEGLLP